MTPPTMAPVLLLEALVGSVAEDTTVPGLRMVVTVIWVVKTCPSEVILIRWMSASIQGQ